MSTELVHLTDRGDIGAVMRPVGSVDALRQAFLEYQELTKSLLTDDDYQTIGNKRFPKKSAWRKLSTAFGVSFKIADKQIEYDEEGRAQRAEFTVTATAPNGRAMDGWGSADLHEKCCDRGCSKGGKHTHCKAAKGEHCDGTIHFSHPNHDIPATAETRAKNRAASDLFGMGEVSAEEVMDAGHSEPPRQQRADGDHSETATAQNDDRALMIRLRRDIRAKAPNHPSLPTLNAMGLKDLKKLAAEVGVAVDSPVAAGQREARASAQPHPSESPSPEGEEPGLDRVAAGSSPEGDWEGHWLLIAGVAGVTLEQVESTLKATAGGKSIQSLKNVSPHSPIGEKLERAMLGGKKESAA